MTTRIGTWVAAIALIAVTVAAAVPMFRPGYFPMHDDTQVARVVELHKALSSGQFPVRWVPDLGYGYGYPLFSYYGPLPYYVGAAFRSLGMTSTDSTKAMFVVGIALSAACMWILGRRLFGAAGALAASVFFVLAPYHAVQIYVRGAVGEYYATAFIPLAVLGAFLLTGGASVRKRGMVAAVGGLTGIILSHTIYGFIAAGIWIGFILFMTAIRIVRRSACPFGWEYIRFLAYALIVSLDLTAFFWLPAFAEMGATSVGKVIGPTSADYRQHFVCAGQLWQSPWGFGGSAPGCIDGMSFKIGKLHVLAAIAGILSVLPAAWRTAGRVGQATAAGIILVLSVVAVLPVSAPLWAVVPQSGFIQYPWRFLAVTAFAVSLAAGLIATVPVRRWVVWTAVAVLGGVCVYMNLRLFVPQHRDSRGDWQMAIPDDIRWRVSNVSDEYMPADFVRPASESALPQTDAFSVTTGVHIRTLRKTPTTLTLSVGSPAPARVTVNRAWYPGWTYSVNGKTVRPDVVNGLPSVVVSQGTSTVYASLNDTPVRAVGNVLSLVTAVLFVVILYGKKTHT